MAHSEAISEGPDAQRRCRYARAVRTNRCLGSADGGNAGSVNGVVLSSLSNQIERDKGDKRCKNYTVNAECVEGLGRFVSAVEKTLKPVFAFPR